jgi:hypothetical protein
MTDQSPQGKGLRICLRLDPAMLVEALILKRLAALPKPRHPEWLRTLLTQGFLTESRVLQALRRGTNTHSGNERPARPLESRGLSFGAWLERSTHANNPSAERIAPLETPSTAPLPPNLGDKPFAHLRNVIG